MVLSGHLEGGEVVVCQYEIQGPEGKKTVELTFRVLNNLGGLALHDGDGRVGGTQIDTDHSSLHLAICRLVPRKGRGGGLAQETCRACGSWELEPLKKDFVSHDDFWGGGRSSRSSAITYSSRQARWQHLEVVKWGWLLR